MLFPWPLWCDGVVLRGTAKAEHIIMVHGGGETRTTDIKVQVVLLQSWRHFSKLAIKRDIYVLLDAFQAGCLAAFSRLLCRSVVM